MRKFEEFLAETAAAGVTDSEGSFSLATEQALKKMSGFTLGAPEEWILKVVQAAVIAKSKHLDFRIRRNAIQVDITSNHEWDLEEFAARILNPDSREELLWKELFVGLRSLLISHRYLLSDSQGKWVTWDGREFQSGDEKKALPGGSSLRILVRKKTESFVDYAKDQVARATEVANYQALLNNRAIYAPLQMTLDGRSLSSRDRLAYREAIMRETSEKKGALALLWAQISPDGDVDLSKAPWRPFRDQILSRTYFLSTKPRERQEDDHYFSLRYNFVDTFEAGQHNEPGRWQRKSLESRFSVRLLRWGVVCGSQSFYSALEGEYVLPANLEATDLTGLQLEMSSNLLQNCRESLCELEGLVDTLLDELSAHRGAVNVTLPQWKDAGAIGGGVGGGFTVSAFMHGLALVSALKGGLLLGGLVVPFLSRMERLNSHNRRLLLYQVAEFQSSLKVPTSHWRADEL